MSETPILVYVDDMPHNLLVFKEGLPESWEIHTFENPIIALNELPKITPWLVISNYSMTKMDGLDFLSKVKSLYPKAKLTLVSGYLEDHIGLDNIKNLGVRNFILKPWDTEKLEATLTEMINSYRNELKS